MKSTSKSRFEAAAPKPATSFELLICPPDIFIVDNGSYVCLEKNTTL